MSKQTELAQVADTITVNSGNVGIGTDSPARTLEVYSTAPAIKLNNGTNAFTIGTGAFVDGSNSLVFFDEGVGERMRIDASGNVGIGVTPSAWASGQGSIQFKDGGLSAWSNGALNGYIYSNAYYDGTNNRYINNGSAGSYAINNSTGAHVWFTAPSGTAGNAVSFSESMRIDSSGNLLVGKTASSISTVGGQINANGQIRAIASGLDPVFVNRLTSDGDIIKIAKDGTTVGSIGSHDSQRLTMGNADVGLIYQTDGTDYIGPFNMSTGSGRDNAIDLGLSANRFNDAFITNGVTTGSDGNDKQDIRDLTEAEQRVAVACKGLLKAWRWKSAVEEKGDDARIHVGIIAQDLQAAFAAEGLDAGRYAMFMSNTWWEHDVEVPAVEAVAEVLDEEGNVVTEAVEAVDAYTRTDTYETQEEAPEGATERTRLGVRYSELLAFIIAAI